MHQSGLTLLEMLVTSAILAVLLSLAIPYSRGFIDVQRLKNMSETLVGDLYFAKTESIKRNAPVSIQFSTNGNTLWSYVSTPDILGNKSNDLFPGVRMTSVTFAGNQVTFDPVRGTASSVGQIHLSTEDNSAQLRINVGLLGQVKVCSPAIVATGHYPPC